MLRLSTEPEHGLIMGLYCNNGSLIGSFQIISDFGVNIVPYLTGYKTGFFPSKMTSNN